MKTKAFYFTSLVLILSGLTFPLASAYAVSTVNVDVRAKTDIEERTEETERTGIEVKANSTTSVRDRDDDDFSSTTEKEKEEGSLTSESHRSVVAAFVHSLLSIADREGGIGSQVRVIARSQEESASTTAVAMTKIEKRNKVKTFLIGSDYKSLGELRSQMVTTKKNIDKLKELQNAAVSTSDKAELEAQIKVLEDSQVKMEAFIKAQEDSVSLFGWLAKFLAK